MDPPHIIDYTDYTILQYYNNISIPIYFHEIFIINYIIFSFLGLKCLVNYIFCWIFDKETFPQILHFWLFEWNPAEHNPPRLSSVGAIESCCVGSLKVRKIIVTSAITWHQTHWIIILGYQQKYKKRLGNLI